MQRGIEVDKDVATSSPGTSGLQHKKNATSGSESTYRRTTKDQETSTSHHSQKKLLFLNPETSDPEHSNSQGTASRCGKIFDNHRLSCIFFGGVSLIFNATFATVFAIYSNRESSTKNFSELAMVGSCGSILFAVSSICLIVGAVWQKQALLWVPMIMTLLQFIPFAIFVYESARVIHADDWLAVTLTCIFSFTVLALCFHQLLQIVSYYVDLGRKDEQRSPLRPSSRTRLNQ